MINMRIIAKNIISLPFFKFAKKHDPMIRLIMLERVTPKSNSLCNGEIKPVESKERISVPKYITIVIILSKIGISLSLCDAIPVMSVIMQVKSKIVLLNE